MKTLMKIIKNDFEQKVFPSDTFGLGARAGYSKVMRILEKSIPEIREHVLSQQREKVGNKPSMSKFINQSEFQTAFRLWEIEKAKLDGMIEAFDAIEGGEE